LPNYFSITKGQLVASTLIPLTIIIGVGAGPFMPRGGGSSTITKAQVILTFNLVTKFFEELRTNYQGVKMDRLHTL